MTPVDNYEPEHGDDDLIAAEYVLGVLPAEQRRVVGMRIGSEPGFSHLVDKWEAHFAPMAAGYPMVEAPPSIKAALDRRLFPEVALPPSPVARRRGLWSSLALWRGLTVAAVAALAVYVAVARVRVPAAPPDARFIASLAGDGNDVRYLAVYDARRSEVRLTHLAGERSAGHDFELWMIEGNNPPVSVGVIPAGATAHLKMSPEAQKNLGSGAVLAVSLEPTGGSPTGQPTGPIVATGDLKDI